MWILWQERRCLPPSPGGILVCVCVCAVVCVCGCVPSYRMRVHLFGAVSSPGCANYALRRTAEDNASEFPPEVISTVNNNFYVDDCLKSTASEEDTIQIVKDLTALCNKGGFNLQKWVTNGRSVLMSIPGDIRATEMKELDLDTDQLPMERALGLQWCVESEVHVQDFSAGTAADQERHFVCD